MILLFSLNAAEGRRGITELVMAVVIEGVLLNFEEARACFPIETEACFLEWLCKAFSGVNEVQCLVLEKSSVMVAHEICNLSVGNLGVLRQINDTTGTVRFCLCSDVGKTAVVRLSTGTSVYCKYTVSWPKVAIRASGRRGKSDGNRARPNAGGESGMSGAEGGLH
jgi:hypothetical protein